MLIHSIHNQIPQNIDFRDPKGFIYLTGDYKNSFGDFNFDYFFILSPNEFANH